MKNIILICFLINLILSGCKHEENNSNNESKEEVSYKQEMSEKDSIQEKIKTTESLDSIYILEREPDMPLDIKSLPFEPDFGYVANNSFYLADEKNLKPAKLPIQGEVLCFTWSPDRKFIYFALKAGLNKITKLKIEELNLECDAYDLKIYKFNPQKPFKAEYITTLFNRTNENSAGDYFLDYGNTYFQMTCRGDKLIVPCEPGGAIIGFMSNYIVSINQRKAELCSNKKFDCIFPVSESLIEKDKLKFVYSDFNLKVFFNSNKTLLLDKNNWKNLFKENTQFNRHFRQNKDLTEYFEFSLSPNSNKVVFSVFTSGDMDVRSGTSYISNLKDSAIFEISSRVVLGGWYAEHRWLSNDNLLIHSSKYNELYIIETEKAQITKIENVVSFQAAPFK